MKSPHNSNPAITIVLLLAVGLLFFLAFVGCVGQAPQVIIYKYDYRVKPPALAPGESPPPPGIPPVADYPTKYPGQFEDPSLVIFRNNLSSLPVWFRIDKGPEFKLEPDEITADKHFGRGKHIVRVKIKIPTGLGEIWEKNETYSFTIETDSCSREIGVSGNLPQYLYIYERCL